MKKNKIYDLLTSPVFILLFLLTVNFIISIFQPMNNDEGIFSYVGRAWSQNGIPPYQGSIENKTPGIFELYAVSNFLFGVNVFFVRILGIIAVLINSYLIYLIGEKIHSHLAGIFSMYLFGLISTWGLLNGIFISHTEVFMVMFSTMSFYFVIKGKDSINWKYLILLAGVSMGFAIAFKQIAVTSALALLLFFIYTYRDKTIQNKITGIILVGTGIFISTLLSIIPLLLSGVSVKEYLEGAWLILLNSGSSSSLVVHISRFSDMLVFSRFALIYPFLFLLIIQRDLLKNRYFVGLFIWILFDFIGVNSSGYYYGHQIRQLIPSLSIILGVLFAASLSGLFKRNSNQEKYLSFIIITLIVLILPYGSLFIGTKILLSNKQNDPNKEIGIWLRNNTHKNDFIFIVNGSGNPALAYSERVSSSKYFNSTFITDDNKRLIVLNDLQTKPPVFILKLNTKEDDEFHIDPIIENLIRNHYSLKIRKYNYDIFKRN